MATKLNEEQKRTLRAALHGLRSSYVRQRTKYSVDMKPEFVTMVDKELTKVAALLFAIEEL